MIQPETIKGRKDYFQRKRDEFVRTWITDLNGVVHIPLENGKEATFSGIHKDIVSQFKWTLKAHKKKGVIKYYAEAGTTEETSGKFGQCTSLHRVILGLGKGNKLHVDHKDGNGLNCEDSNIRVATPSQNASNRIYVNSNGYRGVVKDHKSKRNKYVAQITHNGVNIYLGRFPTVKEAAKKYNERAIQIFGKFAILNKIP